MGMAVMVGFYLMLFVGGAYAVAYQAKREAASLRSELESLKAELRRDGLIAGPAEGPPKVVSPEV